MDKKTIELIEMVVETKETCDERNTCEKCKYQHDGCYNDLNETGLADLIRELYKEVKINTNWGNQ